MRTDNRRQHLLRGRRDHRQDDECDLEKIEKERQKEDEKVNKNQESPGPARQRRQHVFQPSVAVDAEKNDGGAGGSDQDENHHGGYPHGGLIALLDQSAQLGNAVGLETKPSHREIRARKGQLEQQGNGVEQAEQHADRAGDQTEHKDPTAELAQVT